MSLKDEILKVAGKTGGATLWDIYATSGGKKRSRASIRGAVYKMARKGELEKTPEGNYVTLGETPATDSADDTESEEESRDDEESETESTGPESTPQKDESEEETPERGSGEYAVRRDDIPNGTRVFFTHKRMFRSGEVVGEKGKKLLVQVAGLKFRVKRSNLIGYWPEGVKANFDNLVKFE